MLRRWKRMKEEDGQGIAEFAIAIPLVLFVLLGILEFGWLFNAKITLTSAAREGARVAVVSTIDQRNRAYIASSEAVAGVSGITIPNDSTHFKYSTNDEIINNTNNAIVEIKGLVQPLVGLFFNGPVEIQAKAVMRIE
ncbi:TadE/TadG family type IV pilus assembly protein [Proteiniclasticum ruminis]|uniref:TadE-like protein n=1 Tax=Proteiniclasticum ruminis TaxID=398199 RepID=A0A1I5D6S5_9CLOT|nr:TadE family protein [Proteiniclasticum ruminis]SFN94903.1 TadE-like protein [Proteiniclasticum ruminis]